MLITIFNGNPDPTNTRFETYILDLKKQLEAKGNSVTHYTLRENDIHPCTGCMHCFTRTPGICVFKDKASEYVKKHVNSDISLFASPLVMGLPTYLIKCVQDRLCPALHPMKHFVKGMVHQRPRYDKQAAFSVLIDADDDFHTDEDVQRVFTLFDYFGENYDTPVKVKSTMNTPVSEVADALSAV